MTPNKPNNSPQTVERALNILEYIVDMQKPLGVLELSDKLNLNKSTIYRILQALVSKGYLHQRAEDSKYCVGYKILELNTKIIRNLGLRQVSVSAMEKLAQKAKETVALGVIDQRGVVYVDQIGGEEDRVRIHFRMGVHMPFHSTGAGKAALAFFPQEERDAILSNYKLEKFTKNTITNIGSLHKELKEIRQKGYSFNDGETQEMVRVVGAPIFDSQNKVVGSIVLAALTNRFALEQVPTFGKLVLKAAMEISNNLGCGKDCHISSK
ncbi:IclR family transcriptional regulator [Desulfoferula mesophila]|uniref:IclR family transcriptional regulator n=2 Tax=Desulfoferula mesophila TaxID=3058419 RepID=A0AAU9ET14_9BACT|nr:IclR family transcriptional regulator [Desulfoferula mesophilus]